MTVVRSQKSEVSKMLTLGALLFATSFVSAMVFALCPSAEAQQPARMPRIGFVSGTGNPHNPGSLIGAFREGLNDLGYFEGKNILVDYRYFEGIETVFRAW